MNAATGNFAAEAVGGTDDLTGPETAAREKRTADARPVIASPVFVDHRRPAELTHHDDEDAGSEAEPGEKLLRYDIARGEERDQSEREDARRVGNRHRRSEKEGVASGAAGADEISADDGLAVTG